MKISSEQICSAIKKSLFNKDYAAPVEILMEIGVLSKKDHEAWRFGQVPYLEKVCSTNLKNMSEIMKQIRIYAQKTGLKASWTFYHQYGKGSKKQLRFSKSGNKYIEEAYATHYLARNESCNICNGTSSV